MHHSSGNLRIAIITKAFAQSNNDYAMPPLIDLVRAISGRVSLDIYALNYPHERRSYDLFGARVHAFGLGRLSGLTAKRALTRRLLPAHAEHPYDLIHAVWADQPGTLAAGLARRLDLPLITTLYAGEAVWLPQIGYGSAGHPRRTGALAGVLQHSAAVTAGSAALAALVQDRFSTPVQVIPLGYDPTRFAPDGPRAGLGSGRHVVTAASFGTVKGLDRLVTAVGTLAQSSPDLVADTTWHVTGPDPRDRNLRRALLDRIGALPIRLRDAVPHWEMPHLYRAADLAMVPSWFESQCFAAIEAAACGTPVMGTAVGILPEMVSPDWLCPATDSAALAGLMANVLSTPDSWAAEGARQRAWALDNATLDAAGSGFLALYAAAGPRGKAA